MIYFIFWSTYHWCKYMWIINAQLICYSSEPIMRYQNRGTLKSVWYSVDIKDLAKAKKTTTYNIHRPIESALKRVDQKEKTARAITA